MAVTKRVPAASIRQAVAVGETVLGENYVQEALGKMDEIGPGVRWHLIGHLQRNKVKQAVSRFDLIHSVDSPDLGREINEQAGRTGIRQRVLVQVNVARESGKRGVSPEQLDERVRELVSFPHLSVEGLMTLPPFSEDPEETRPHFRWLAERGRILRESGLPIRELSMGMSNDFEAAVEEGATLIRVGTAIFGPRE